MNKKNYFTNTSLRKKLLSIGLTVVAFTFKGILSLTAQTTVLTYNASGSWVVPANVTSATFEIWGGGGGGGGASGSSSYPGTYGTTGGGGGGGGYSSTTISVTSGNSYT